MGVHGRTGIRIRGTAESVGELGCATGRGDQLNPALRDQLKRPIARLFTRVVAPLDAWRYSVAGIHRVVFAKVRPICLWTVRAASRGQRRSIRSLGRGVFEDLDHLVIEQLGNV